MKLAHAGKPEGDVRRFSSWAGHESILRDHLAATIRRRGMEIVTEAPARAGGRADIAAYNLGHDCARALVEVKVNDPIRGVGQLLAYGCGITCDPDRFREIPFLVLAVEEEILDDRTILAATAADIEVWCIDRGRFYHEGGPNDLYRALGGA